MTYEISLIKDTIDYDDIKKLIKWLESNPKLTKGPNTEKFEKEWSKWTGAKYSIYVNSGSSANLLAFYTLIQSGKMKNKKVIVPALSWATTVAPAIQLGLEPIMCDCSMSNLGLDLEHLQQLIEEHDPSIVVTVNVLGFANDYDEITKLCKDNDCLLLEDSCESIGTIYNNKKTGTFGDISTFSFYFGHHLSTIEGGMVCTSDESLRDLLLALRSHGWDRDLSKQKQEELRLKNGVGDFRSLYTFYYPGFNVRSTDLQAFIGLEQMKKIDFICQRRKENFDIYNSLLKKPFLLNDPKHQFISNFAFPFINKQIIKIIQELQNNSIETRPLISGSIARQPFWTNLYGNTLLKNADYIHENGIYLPNNPKMTPDMIEKVVSILNKYL